MVGKGGKDGKKGWKKSLKLVSEVARNRIEGEKKKERKEWEWE